MKLRDYQEESINALFAYFANGGKGNPLALLPTGSGKSLVISAFMQRVMFQWPDQRFLMITHVKELISQNAKKIIEMWPNAPVGIYSAGLGEKNHYSPIVCGGIASMIANPSLFGHRDLILVDEAHTISNKANSMYQTFFAELRKINPFVRVIGFTATGYRMGQGQLIEPGSLFTDVAYDITDIAGFNRLLRDGYLAPLIPKRTNTAINTENVKVQNGEFQQHDLQAAVDVDEITHAAISEMLELGYDRHCGLIFTTGIDHCEHVVQAITSFGETATFVHSKMGVKDRDAAIEGFKAGKYKYIVSNGVLTTGFDHPPIDLIAVLRPTMSASLWVQMLGRGTRPYDGSNPLFPYYKENCLVLDFAQNTKRLGPINDPVKPRPKGQKAGDAPIRICDECGTYNHASARFCVTCGQVFPVYTKIFAEAGTEELIRTPDMPVVETFNIDRVIYHRHDKVGSFPMIRVSYYSGLKRFEEYVCIEHPGYAGRKALEWWKRRSGKPMPASTDMALAELSNLKQPARIKVHTNKKYPEIVSHEF